MADNSERGPDYSGAIAGIESGNEANPYTALGPVVKGGDKAYGKYQIMGANIPSWTQEILGFSMTPKEFLKDPAAQERVFQGKFGQYVQKYGPEGAARAWIGGPGNVNNPNAIAHDQQGRPIGLTVGQYGQRFTNAMAPPLGTTNVGGAPPVAGPQPPPQLPAASQQQPQLAAAPQQLGGGMPPAAQALGAPQTPQPVRFPPLQMPQIQYYRPQINPQAFAKIPLPPGFLGYQG